ncbi:unnamed protein product [Brugia pahangi]|uniref:Uncharacterized protein n=1 Tax=Brugia pahangi TaxID=6280 RepID=A0A0N4SZS9_BRUPA|nr:unnamed protein product [Brugia pahangi]
MQIHKICIYATIIVTHSNLISNFKNAASMSEAIMANSKLPMNYGTTNKAEYHRIIKLKRRNIEK